MLGNALHTGQSTMGNYRLLCEKKYKRTIRRASKMLEGLDCSPKGKHTHMAFT